MKNTYCKLLCKSNNPLCSVYKTLNGYCIEELLSDAILKPTESLVCHKFAQSFANGSVYISDDCDECMLCNICCPVKTEKLSYLNANTEKVIFSDFKKLAIMLTALFKNKKICSETNAVGNFRTKRIDVCIVDENKIFLIKVLKTVDKFPFYKRSYGDIIEYYSGKFPDYTFLTVV